MGATTALKIDRQTGKHTCGFCHEAFPTMHAYVWHVCPVTCYVCETLPATRLDVERDYQPICDACYRPYAMLEA